MSIRLVPSMGEANIMMYCNYARMNTGKNCCLECTNNCKHKGERTVFACKDEMHSYFEGR